MKRGNQPAEILREKYSKQASLKVYRQGSWELFAGNSIESLSTHKPILEGVGEGVYPLNVNTSRRLFFKFRSDGHDIIIAERQLPMAGCYNFRDLGGYKAKGGKHVKWGKLFRADDISGLTEEDLVYLSSIPIISAVDFRAPSEAKRSPDKLPKTARFSYPIAITPGNLSNEGIQANLLQSNINLYMKQMNRLLVSDPACVRAFRIFFAIVQNNLSAPIVFHCSAGKDRTGMAAALILYSLGVDEKTIMEDYLLSNACLTDKYEAIITKYPRSEPMFTAKRMFLQAGINQIKRDHGSVINFLTDILKVNIAKMRKLYLE